MESLNLTNPTVMSLKAHNESIKSIITAASKLETAVTGVESIAAGAVQDAASNTTAIGTLNTRVGELDSFKTTATSSLEALQTAVTGKVDSSVYATDKTALEGSVTAAIATAKSYTDTEIGKIDTSTFATKSEVSTLQTEITNNTNRLDEILQDSDQYLNSFKELQDLLNAAADGDGKITSILDGIGNKVDKDDFQTAMDLKADKTEISTLQTTITDGLATKADLAGATFTGPVKVPVPTTDTDAATKKYVDDAVASFSTVFTGEGKFSGITGTTINVPAEAGTTYRVAVTPIGIPDGSVGDFGVVKGANSFVVYNTGDATVDTADKFEYVITPIS